MKAVLKIIQRRLQSLYSLKSKRQYGIRGSILFVNLKTIKFMFEDWIVNEWNKLMDTPIFEMVKYMFWN